MNGSPFSDNLISSEKNLRDYVDVVLRRAWVVIVVFILAVLIATIYAWTRTPFYRSIATVELEEKSSKVKDKDSVYGSPEYDQFKGYSATQIEILKSASLADALVVRMNLVANPEFASHDWFSPYLQLLGINDENGAKSISSEDARKRSVTSNIGSRVAVKPVKQSNLIQISMDAKDPMLASEMLQNYIDLYLERNLEEETGESPGGFVAERRIGECG